MCVLRAVFPFLFLASALVRNSIEAMKLDGVEEVHIVITVSPPAHAHIVSIGCSGDRI